MHIGHMIANAMVHGLIYATIFKIGHQIGLLGMIALCVIGIALLWIFVRLLGDRR
jgi:threonine/homoserine/homoserine lactone efflux protein